MPDDANQKTKVFDAQAQMLATRKSFAWWFKWGLIVFPLLMVLTIGFTFYLILREKAATETALYVRLMQITLGMIFGAACVFFGVLLSWLGIQESFAFGGQGGNAQMQLRGTGPGIALIVGGVVLIGASLYKEVHYQETVEPDQNVIRPIRGNHD
jgi:hypothetical protein